VKENGIFVIIPKYGIEEKIFFSSQVSESEKKNFFFFFFFKLRNFQYKKGEKNAFVYDEENQKLTCTHNTTHPPCCSFRLFDKLRATISVVRDNSAGSIAGECVRV
jgi:hypothetical protein